MHILVVGGAGFIGSHMVRYLSQQDCRITVLDNLSSGHRDAVLYGEFIEGDLMDIDRLNTLFSDHSFDLVMHFASSIEAGESVQKPTSYYRNNVVGAMNLLDAMLIHDVRQLVFSSSAAIFGESQYTPIDENHPKAPANPYGHSKLMVEQILSDYDRAYGLKSVCLRYFNAAGAAPDAMLGERHRPETHVIPLLLQVASGRRDAFTVYGNDYPTSDGTCIRDYIHVNDLCRAHWLAVNYLEVSGQSGQFNLGNGQGFSVRQVIDVCKGVTGREIEVEYGSRRAGDPSVLVADSNLARTELGWEPCHLGLDTMIADAWLWEQRMVGEGA